MDKKFLNFANEHIAKTDLIKSVTSYVLCVEVEIIINLSDDLKALHNTEDTIII